MKQGIHPQYFEDAKISCACGHTVITGATQQEIHVDVCSNCHPFFTGQMKFVDTLGNVDKFQKRQEKAKVYKSQVVKKIEERHQRVRPNSLKDMIDLAKKQASS